MGEWLEKRRPGDGELLCHAARSRTADVEALDVYTDWKYVNLIADRALT